jgi:cytochrome c
MRRSVVIGSVCTAYLIQSASSSVAQELLQNDRDLVARRLIFYNACRTCHTTSEGDNRLGPNLYKIIGRKQVRCRAMGIPVQ